MEKTCAYCTETEDLMEFNEWWVAWGHHAGDLNFHRETGEMLLCEQCRDEVWSDCAECGDLISIQFAGYGYEWPNDEIYEHYCMPCAEKLGYTVTAGIGPPPPRVLSGYVSV